MSAFVVDSAASIERAKVHLGQAIYPQGRCLANVYLWMLNGRSSTGPGAGKFATAMDGWNYAERKHAGDLNAPAGVAVYFGPSPTRTDKNKNAGDVGLSIGGGLGIFTDANGARVGIMSFQARAIQTQRPYLGWTEDFLGYDTSAANGLVPPVVTTSGPILAQNDEDEMRVIANTKTNAWVAASPGKWDAIPSGQGGLYLSLAGQGDVLRLSEEDFLVAKDVYLHMQETGLYAVVDGPNKDQWFVIGPNAYKRVKPGEDFTPRYGSVRRIKGAELDTLRSLYDIAA